MPKGYGIVRVSVRDEARYPEYLAAARPAFEKFGANFLVRGGAFEAMEGHARERNVGWSSRIAPPRSPATRAPNIRRHARCDRNMPTATS
jgi:Domain of unknown function (DUF1330)